MHQAIPYITRWRRPWLCGCHWQYATSEPRWWSYDLQKLSGELQKRRRPFSSFSPDLNSETILQNLIYSLYLSWWECGGGYPKFFAGIWVQSNFAIATLLWNCHLRCWVPPTMSWASCPGWVRLRSIIWETPKGSIILFHFEKEKADMGWLKST